MSINQQWKPYLEAEFQKDYMKKITAYLKEARLTKEIYPPSSQIYAALNIPPERVSVVIVGQDPYHGANQANGLAFSVNKGVTVPPSLKNIYKELKNEYMKEPPLHGDLTNWVNQGVLLLNTSLTVEASTPASHASIGWTTFTDEIIKSLSKKFEGVVYMLWGAHAKSKIPLINAANNLILASAHPSPFSVTKFLGNNHFKLANEYLRKHGKPEIDWFDV